MPLLVHTGAERSFSSSHDSLGDPQLLHLPLKEGASVLIYKGKYTGQEGTVEGFDETGVVVKTPHGSIHTRKAYAFVTGEKKPAITCAP